MLRGNGPKDEGQRPGVQDPRAQGHQDPGCTHRIEIEKDIEIEIKMMIELEIEIEKDIERDIQR